MKNYALKVVNLRKKYGRFEAVRGVSFNVEPGEIFGLIGPNGAGKSTALKCIATILSPSDGKIEVFGKDATKDANSVRSMISYLPEEAGAYKNLTGIHYLQFMAELFVAKNEIKACVERGEKIADLGSKIKNKINTYSKGMTRKLLLARTVMIKPKLAILDEPTSGLDVINALSIRKTVRELAKNGMAVLLSSHNMLEIEYLSDKVGILHNGRIIETGTANELKNKHRAKNLEEVFAKITE